MFAGRLRQATLASLLYELAGMLQNGADYATILGEVIRYTELHFASDER